MAKKINRQAKIQPPTVLDHLLETVAAHGRRMDAVEEIVGSWADADPKIKETMIKRFGRGRKRVQVFLALDGIRDATAIGKVVGMSRQNVNAELRELVKHRLIDIAASNGRGTIYRKLSIDRRTGISYDLMTKFKLDKDGRQLK